ncbi:MAG: lysophospholipid acyltransferase family protein [Halochromatium sp.]
MNRFRASLFEAFLWLSVLGYGLLMRLLALGLSRQRLMAIALHWQRAVLWGLRRLCGIDYRVQGEAHLLEGRGQIILSNHQSAWETIALGRLLPMPQTWVMKQELLRIPFFGWALSLFEPIAIDRSAGRQAMRQLLTVGAERLARGHCLVIFPEGTRVAPGASKRFGLGGALLAERPGAPVVPIAHNAGCFWGRQTLGKYAGTIDVVIGPPIETQGLSAQEINRRAEDWIRTTTQALVEYAAGANPAAQGRDTVTG